ncbi:MAG: protein jag [Angustibacter sp.]
MNDRVAWDDLVKSSNEALGKDLEVSLEGEGETAADYLEKFLDIADLDGDIDVDVANGRAVLAIVDSEEGSAPGHLVGAKGEALEALQEITRLVIFARTGRRSRLILDIAGYRATRRSYVLAKAEEAVEQVKETGISVELDPMPPFERKVVHDLAASVGLTTRSFGAEPERFVSLGLI